MEVGGTDIHLESAGATLYDRTLAMEVKDKYKWDPNVKVIEKPYVSLNDGHRSTFVVPELPWKKETRPRVEPPAADETDALSADDGSGS